MKRLTIEEILDHCKRKTEMYEKNVTADYLNTAPMINAVKEYWEHKQVAEYLEELMKFREMEAQERLLRLPCKIGDTLYCIDNGIVELLIVNSFKIYNFNRIEIDFENASGFTLCTFLGELDEGYFLTREEAEKKLEEMKGEHDAGH